MNRIKVPQNALPLLLIFGCLVLTACSLPGIPRNSNADLEASPERLAQASEALTALKETDLLLRLENATLRKEMLRQFSAINALPSGWVVREPTLIFGSQIIGFSLLVLPAEDAPREDAVRLQGELRLSYQSGQVLWQPLFQAPTAAGAPSWDLLTDELLRAFHGGGLNALTVNPMPLANLDTGAQLASVGDLIAQESQTLDGVFVTAGAAVLIDEQFTSLALDLNFLPSIASCADSLSISRATFAGSIRNREPVDSVLMVGQEQDIQHFYTEVSGTTAPGAIIHYWFADGEPASVSELEIQPSARWRTWSSRPKDRRNAGRWEVVVVEKDTGCVLETMAVLSENDPLEAASTDPAPAAPTYAQYREQFTQRTSGFPAPRTTEQLIATVDVRRGFMTNVLSDALYDVQVVSALTYANRESVAIEGSLQAFPSSDIQCTPRQCDSSTECTINYNNCPLERDTRVCTSCLFRNPLNNRCMSEAEDPICVAAREAANERLSNQRERCVGIETQVRDACEALRKSDLISCQRQSASQRGACEAGRDQLTLTAANDRPLAAIRGDAVTEGSLEVQFSRFRLEGDLQRLRMELGIIADLSVRGGLALDPADPQGALAACLTAWQGPYQSTTPDTQWQSGLVSALDVGDSTLTAQWSGFTQQFGMHPAPFQALFLNNPEALQECGMGLDSARVVGSVGGLNSDFLSGTMELEIQPLPTRITLLPAYLQVAETTHSGVARVGEGFVSYDIVQNE